MESLQQFEKFCAHNHELIGYSELFCPLCTANKKLEEGRITQRILANRIVKLESGIREATVRAREMGV